MTLLIESGGDSHNGEIVLTGPRLFQQAGEGKWGVGGGGEELREKIKILRFFYI